MKKTLLLAVVLLFNGCFYNKTPKPELNIEILHINDTHSHLEPTLYKIYINNTKTYVYAGGYAKIAQYVKEKESDNPNVIMLHAGDALQGTLYYTLFKGKADVEAMNLMHIDAMSVGNHEWDDGADSFAENFALLANFPIISCDINASENALLKNIIKPYIIKTINNQKIAIIGDSIDSSVISNPGPTIKFLNYLTSAQEYVKKLQTEGINKIIFLTHLGYETDKYLASNVKGIDIIVGGHSHTLLGNFQNLGLDSEGEYPTVIENNGSKTLIVTAWKWGLVIGDLNVTFDSQGNIIKYSGTPVMLIDDKFLRKNASGEITEVNDTVKEEIEKSLLSMNNIKTEGNSPEVEDVINKYKPEVTKLLEQNISYATADLINVRLPGQTDPDTNITLEHGSLIAPLVALAMYEKGVNTGGCDFSIENAGAVRISIPQGNVTIGEIYTLLPFGNTLVKLKMPGKDIKTMLENAVERSLITKTDTGAFPYLGNAKILIDPNAPENNKIVDFEIKDSYGNWHALDLNKTYTIVTNSYIANGGDYYIQMQETSDKTDTGFLNAEIFIDYAKKHTLSPLPEDETPATLIK